jgi:hypothetical protein
MAFKAGVPMFGRKDKVPGQAPAPPVAPRTSAGPARSGSPGKQAYEARRAQKAGMGLDKWMAEKDRRALAERNAEQQARVRAEPTKPGLLRRLLDRAHRPI